ncbi:hypothetical protein C8J56DRAFT_873564 [Mycena floridula]|nr:hypothetical protein C8J56DRAFT_873564 [Mycena floridula]
MSTPLTDLSQESCPDFNTPAFDTDIQKIIAEKKVTKEEAIKHLTEEWEKSHAERIAAFKAANPEPPPTPSTRKIPRVNTALAVPTVHDSRPSSYALDKVNKFGYCELWYFTPEGCEDAALSQRSIDADGYGLARGDSSSAVTLKPISSLKASSKAIPDASLPWELFEQGSTQFLQAIEFRCNWPKDLVEQFAAFFHGIKNHSMRREMQGAEEIGKRVLLRYADINRVDWHDRVLRDEETFNIGIINEELINRLSNQIRRELFDELAANMRAMNSTVQFQVRTTILDSSQILTSLRCKLVHSSKSLFFQCLA